MAGGIASYVYIGKLCELFFNDSSLFTAEDIFFDLRVFNVVCFCLASGRQFGPKCFLPLGDVIMGDVRCCFHWAPMSQKRSYFVCGHI